jgi:hypothetical protein
VSPCDLLIVVANESRIGNWCLRNLKGKNGSDYVKGILGIRTRFPLLDPVGTSQATAWFCKCRSISQIPLHKPWLTARLRRSITTALRVRVSFTNKIHYDRFRPCSRDSGWVKLLWKRSITSTPPSHPRHTHNNPHVCFN